MTVNGPTYVNGQIYADPCSDFNLCRNGEHNHADGHLFAQPQ